MVTGRSSQKQFVNSKHNSVIDWLHYQNETNKVANGKSSRSGGLFFTNVIIGRQWRRQAAGDVGAGDTDRQMCRLRYNTTSLYTSCPVLSCPVTASTGSCQLTIFINTSKELFRKCFQHFKHESEKGEQDCYHCQLGDTVQYRIIRTTHRMIPPGATISQSKQPQLRTSCPLVSDYSYLQT